MLDIDNLESIRFVFSHNLNQWYVLCENLGYLGTINSKVTAFTPSKFFVTTKKESIKFFTPQESEYLKLKLL
jgi:hypothetical protein